MFKLYKLKIIVILMSYLFIKLIFPKASTPRYISIIYFLQISIPQIFFVVYNCLFSHSIRTNFKHYLFYEILH